LFEIEVTEHRPLAYQSENWLVSSKQWKLVARPAPVGMAAVVRAAITTQAPLLGCWQNRRAVRDFPTDEQAASLALVAPETVGWQVNAGQKGRQVRCQFDLIGTSYDVPVTDPVWESRLRGRPLGFYEAHDVGSNEDDRPLLCISVGEPYKGNCYLLLATVILPDAKWRKALYS
jgi:hypothetical protein